MTIDPKELMKDLVSLCKRRGFIFPASDIYGGINGFWDYGPLGVELKNNLRDKWWKDMVITPPIGPDGSPIEIVGLDAAIIQHPRSWEASGHVGGFSDPMVDCKESKKRYRADHLIVVLPLTPKNKDERMFAFFEDATGEEKAARIKKFGLSDEKTIGAAREFSFLDAQDKLDKILGPDAKEFGTLTEPRQFNMMLHTFIGAVLKMAK